MSEKFKITLVASKTALAELIATGLEKHATITGIEAIEAPAPAPDQKPITFTVQAPPAPLAIVPPVEETAKSKAGYRQQIRAWELYEIMMAHYHPQKAFTSADLFEACQREGQLCTRKSVSAHLVRMRRADLIRTVGGGRSEGFLHETKPAVKKKEFHDLMSEQPKSKPAPVKKATGTNRLFGFNS